MKQNINQYHFQLDFSVRDYELDMAGVVNNARYLNYMEHARHEFLKSLGLDFVEFSRKGLNFFLIGSEIDYKGSLTGGDAFTIKIRVETKGRFKLIFYQDLFLKSSGKLMTRAKNTGVCMDENGKPVFLSDWGDKLKNLPFIEAN